MTNFRYPRDLVARLREEWGVVTWRGVDVEPLPPDDVLVPLVETCYFASLTAEEQRPTKFTAFVGEPIGAHDAFEFGMVVPIAVNSIRRLAPAVSGQRLGVRLGPRFGDCGFWGFATASNAHGLQIDVYGPGRLFIGNPLTAWLGLEGGALDHGAGIIGDDMLFKVFAEGFRQFMARVEDPMNEALYMTPFRTWTAMLLTGASERGHGGAIFVVPEAEADGSWRTLARVKYPCDHKAILQCMINVAELKDNHEGVGAFDRVDREIRRVAALTQVDGAVVITDQFRVLGFGVEFTAPPTDTARETVEHKGNARPVEDYGTRHRSAFRFVAACPYATAFVCSQDGGLKCIRNEGGRVKLHV